MTIKPALIMIDPYKHYVKATNVADKYLVSRMAAAINAIASVGQAISFAVRGTLYASVSVLSLGRSVRLNKIARKYLETMASMISSIFLSTISFLNPKATLRTTNKDDVLSEGLLDRLNRLHQRLLTQEYRNKSVGFAGRQLATRAISLIKIPIAIVTRVADFALGVIFAAGAIITFGNSRNLNAAAYRHLQILQVIPDIYQAAIELLNPRGFEGK